MKLIPVERKHIREGERGACEYCPVALALTDAEYCQVSVVGSSVHVGADRDVIELSISVHDWIASFDGADHVKPFTMVDEGNGYICSLEDWQFDARINRT